MVYNLTHVIGNVELSVFQDLPLALEAHPRVARAIRIVGSLLAHRPLVAGRLPACAVHKAELCNRFL